MPRLLFFMLFIVSYFSIIKNGISQKNYAIEDKKKEIVDGTKSNISSAWKKYKDYLARVKPIYYSKLNPPATEKELREFEAFIGKELPKDFKILYGLNNGEHFSYNSDDGNAMLGLRIMTLLQIKQETYYYKGGFSDFPEWYMNNCPVDAIKKSHYHKDWIPIFTDDSGNYIGMDLNPGVRGKYGQIINFGADESGHFVMANSLGEFLTFLNLKIEDGTIKWHELNHLTDDLERIVNCNYPYYDLKKKENYPIIKKLEFRKLDSFPDNLNNFPNLTYLDLSYQNNITQIPKEIGAKHKLESLNLSNNPITELPREIGNLVNLISLRLYSVQLKSLPIELNNLKNLREINLSSDQKIVFPENFEIINNIKYLRLAGNHAEDLFNHIKKNNNLREIALYGDITNLPKEIRFLTQLESLEIYSNSSFFLPASIGKLHNLLMLKIKSNKLVSFSGHIGKLNNLKMLVLSNNQIANIPNKIGKLISIEILDLPHNQLTRLPKQLGKLSQLKSLNLSHNQLTELPKQLDKLSQLKSLNLSHNQLTMFPKQIKELDSLGVLDLSHNQLSSISSNIGVLKNLNWLDLSDNQLKILPKQIGLLKRLTTLNIADNQISMLPNEIYQLKNLRNLYLKNNPIGLEELNKIKALLPNCYVSNK